MSSNTTIAKHTAISVVGKIISTILAVVAFKLLSVQLGVEQYGWYTAVVGLLQFIGIMTDFGMTPVTAQLLGKAEHDATKLVNNLLTFRFFSAVLFFGFSPLLAWVFGFSPILVQATAISAIAFVAMALNQVLLGFYQSRLAMHIHAGAEIISRIALVIGIYIIGVTGGAFLSTMWVITLAALVFMGIMLARAWHMQQLALRVDLSIWKDILAIGWPIAISIMVNTVYLKGDVLLLTQYVNATDLGYYGAAYRIVDVVAQSAMMVMGTLLPVLAYHYTREKKVFYEKFQLAIEMMMGLALPLVVGGMLTAQPLIVLLSSADYAPAGATLMILMFAVLGVYIGAIFGHVAVAIGKQKQTIWVYASNAVLTLLGYLWFIPRYGITGAAYMSAFSELYTGVVLCVVVFSYIRYQLAWRRLIGICQATGGMALVLWWLQGQSIVVLLGAGVLSYAAGLLLTRAVSLRTVRAVLARS